MKYVKWGACILAVLIIAMGAIGYFGFQRPYLQAKNTMPEHGQIVLQQQADGTLLLSWSAAERADFYRVTVSEVAFDEESTPENLYTEQVYGEANCVLPAIPTDRELTLQIYSVVEYKTLWIERERCAETALEISTVFSAPTVSELTWQADPDRKTVTLDYQMAQDDTCRIYLQQDTGDLTQLRQLQETNAVFTFGESGDLPVPERTEPCVLVLDAYRELPGFTFYAPPSAALTVQREDLLGRNLQVAATDEGHNVTTLTWNETKGERYEVQILDQATQQWETVQQVALDEERTYTTPHMPKYNTFAYRVVAVGGQTLPGETFAAVSEEVTVNTKETPVFCTIWPVLDLTVYADWEKTTEIAAAEQGKAYCVLDEQDGMFAVQVDGQVGYIDSTYCMINLPEYIGNLCQYDITNSYSSLYMVHEFEIPEVTDVVTKGYENVQLYDDSFLVPLLYPTAQKLAVAARYAREENLIIRIYDAFRPNKATQDIYDRTELILDEPLPEEPFTDAVLEDLDLPEVQKETNEAGEEIEIPLTYRDVMTNEEFPLSAFLAKGSSLHNLGIALDLTVVDLYTGKPLEMQTSMHDLSRYSILKENTAAADRLAGIMKEAGFATLRSEWWHFQDDEARYGLDLPVLWHGVSAACWMADDNGWRYRNQKGIYLKDCIQTIDGVSYTFDEMGYVLGV